MHGMRAFALEEMNRLAEAEDAGRQAIELKRAEPWAHHAVAHVMETQGRCDEGLAFMTVLAETWAVRNSFMITPNGRHSALLPIEQIGTASGRDRVCQYG